MANDLTLPKEKEPEKKEIIRIENRDLIYVPTPSEEKIENTDQAHAYALQNLISPTTKEGVLSLTKETRRTIILGNGAVFAVEKQINRYRTCKELEKPIYPKFSLYSDLKTAFDLQSNGDGTTRAQITQILSTPQMGFGMPQQHGDYLEHLRRNYVQPESVGPAYMQEPKKKKRLAFLRGGND